MGKKSRRRKNRREKAQARKYQQKHLERQLEEDLRADEFTRRQEDFAKEQRIKQQEVLSRAVFVSNAKDLSRNINLLKLRSFFERAFGPKESCTLVQRRKGRNGPPNARLVFKHKSDADRVLKYKETGLSCPVGFKTGKVRVSHARPSKELFDGKKTDENGLAIAASHLSIGDWCPAGASLDEEIFGNTVHMRRDQWLEAERSGAPFTLKLDLEERRVEIIAEPPPSSDGLYLIADLLQAGVSERLTFRFKDMATPLLLRKNVRGEYLMVVALKHPPRLGRKDTLLSTLSLETDEYVRTLHWQCLTSRALGRFLGFTLRISGDSVRQFLAHRNCSKLRKFGVLDFDFEDLQRTQRVDEIMVGWTYHDRFQLKMKDMENYQLAFRLQQLFDHGRLTAYHSLTENCNIGGSSGKTIFDEIDRLLRMDKSNQTRIEEALNSMLSFTTAPCRALIHLYSSSVDGLKSNVPEYCVVVPRLLISPFRTVASGFEVETSNRGIRYFMKEYNLQPDMFARARFVDEDETQLFNSELNDEISSGLKNSLLSGITVCGRTFSFLAYSSSQLKENSFWMVSIPTFTSIVKMRKELGDFSSCKTVSKYGARLGQCFSTTFSSRGKNILEDPFIIPDIIASNGGCHSDGTGVIRREFLDRFMAGHPLEPDDVNDVAIIQIRYGGAKGTLTAYSEGWFQDHGYLSDILLRESMIKFEGNFSDLEICSIGKPVPYYLNRHVIFLLDALQVPPSTFLSLQEEMLLKINGMMENSDIAREMLSSLMGSANSQLPLLLKMIDAGLHPQTEPFLFDCLSATRNHLLLGLQKKSRILVDDGVVLMGGLDESGLLLEGTVFFQVGTSPRTGPVMVTKHPVMHPGDVRMLLAIDVPELRNHRNVLLFSQHGDRPEADKMSGSDLDGDEFAVTWDARLFLGPWRNCSREQNSFSSFNGNKEIMKNHLVLDKSATNHSALKQYVEFLASCSHEPMDFTPPDEPMDFTPPEAKVAKVIPSDSSDHSEALIDFILDHMKNSTLGQVATLWLDHAALKGANCQECLGLAKVFSTAVDYPKSGVPAEIPGELKIPHETPRPHWREKKGCPTYECQSVIGQLYDQANAQISIDAEIPALMGRRIDVNGTIVCDLQWTLRASKRNIPDVVFHYLSRSFDVETYPEILDFAFEESFQYEGELMEIMNKYKLRGEGEICTGFLRKFNKLNKKRQHHLREEVQRSYVFLQKHHRESFFRKVKQLAMKKQQSHSEIYFDAAEEEHDDILDGTTEMEVNVVGTDEEEDYSLTEAAVSDEEGSFNQSLDNIQSIVTNTWSGTTVDQSIRRIAFGLAAAYYETTYMYDDADDAWGEGRVRLFSFPWLVADVIKSCVAEHLDADE